MNIVEIDNTFRRHAVVGWVQLKFRHEASVGSGNCCNDNGPNSRRNRVTGQYEYWTIATWRDCEPDVTALHRPNPTSLLQDPNQRFLRTSVPHRLAAVQPTP